MAFERMESPDDPRRCQGVIRNQGQCHYIRLEGSEYCQLHGGNKGQERAKRESLSNYRLAKWQVQLNEQLESPHIKSLRDEVGILRMIMQETLDRCATNFDLITSSQKIADLATRITVVVEKCHKLEGSMGQLLDKKTILNMATQFINIIAEEDLPEDVLDRIAGKIMETVAE